MFIKKTTKRVKGKTYLNHLLVESVATEKGPRHNVVCSLGSLEPAPKEQWLALAHKIESSLAGQEEMLSDPEVDKIVKKIRSQQQARSTSVEHDESEEVSDLVSIHTDQVETENGREGGPVHVGHQMWKKLGISSILEKAGVSDRTKLLTELMALNRFIKPSSEHAMPDWIRRTALGDILGTDFTELEDDSLYRNLDRLYPEREYIERELAEKERNLFNLDDQIHLYDLTSTYFEGRCLRNEQAKRGCSRDKRPDCKQVVVGLVLGGEGFPKAHEIFDGNRRDSTTIDEMLDVLESRVGKKDGATVVVDRGMAFDKNLEQIKAHGYHYIVASRQGERDQYLDDYENESDWEEVIRKVSPRNPFQKKTQVLIKRREVGGEIHILCMSEGRVEKDRNIREKQEGRFLNDVEKLKKRITKGQLFNEPKVNQAIGRLKERYPRVARYYELDYNLETRTLTSKEDAEGKEKAKKLDGGYLLKTDRKDMTADEIWKTYAMLTRVETAFRNMKSPLMERPIFHHLQHRVQTHIFLCVLAYHLLVAVEKMFFDRGIHTSWGTIREQLSTHQVVTAVLPASNGDILNIRQATKPEEVHQGIYQTLKIPEKIIPARKTWVRTS